MPERAGGLERQLHFKSIAGLWSHILQQRLKHFASVLLLPVLVIKIKSLVDVPPRLIHRRLRQLHTGASTGLAHMWCMLPHTPPHVSAVYTPTTASWTQYTVTLYCISPLH